MPQPLTPQWPKGPILVNATRRELLTDIAIRFVLMVGVAVLMLKLPNPMNGRVLWPLLISIELIILAPLLLTILSRRSGVAIPPPTADELTEFKDFERSANLRAVLVTILSCFLERFVIINGWDWLIPYPIILPMVLLFQKPPKSRA